MPSDFLIASERVVFPDGERPAAIVVRDGRIAAVSPPGDRPVGMRVVDLGDRVLLPGVVDTHVHINEPGRTDWEGFDTGTRAAIAGGITTLVDMPLNASPVTTTVAAFEQKLFATTGKLHANCGFWGG